MHSWYFVIVKLLALTTAAQHIIAAVSLLGGRFPMLSYHIIGNLLCCIQQTTYLCKYSCRTLTVEMNHYTVEMLPIL